MPQEFPEHPIEVFHRNVWVNPFWEDSVTGLIDLIGADRVCFGSDYPHPEGLDDPISWADELGDTSAADTERIMSTNMFELLGLRPSARLTAPQLPPKKKSSAFPYSHRSRTSSGRSRASASPRQRSMESTG